MKKELIEIPDAGTLKKAGFGAFAAALSKAEFLFYRESGKSIKPRFLEGVLECGEEENADFYHFRCAWPGTGLEGEMRIGIFRETGFLECSGTLRNSGIAVSETLKGPFSITLEFDRSKFGGLRMNNLHGGKPTFATYPPMAYRLHENDGVYQIISARNGWSSGAEAPFCMVMNESGTAGIVTAFEWPGRWIFYISEGNGRLVIAWHQNSGCFSLNSGETAVIPKTTAGFFKGSAADGGNAMRKHFMRYMRLPLDGKKDWPLPVFYNHFFGFGNCFDETLLRREAEFYAKAGCEYFIVDGGWFRKGFRDGIGNWEEPDRAKFPRGFRPFSDYVHSLGMKFGLWFEPEYAMADSDWVLEHPDFYMNAGSFRDEVTNRPHCDRLLRLDRAEVREFLIEFLLRKIHEWRIEWIRWDFNNSPGAFWDANDPDGETGKIQNAYCAGLYEVLDRLEKAAPEVHIETCAGGGGRMDAGSLRRAHSLWMSDQAANHDNVRGMQKGLNRFVPGFANSVFILPQSVKNNSIAFGRTLTPWTTLLSKFAGPLGFAEDSLHFTKKGAEQIAETIRVYKRIRHYLTANFESLFEPEHLTQYDGWRFYDPVSDSGIFAVFRCESTRSAVSLRLKGLRKGKTYHAECLAGDNHNPGTFDFQGGTAFRMELKEKQDSVLYHYQPKEKRSVE